MAGWEERAASATGGGVSNNAGESYASSLALDAGGNPHIAWNDDSGGGDYEIYYAYWDGDSWETYGGANTGGGVSNNAGNSYDPSLALDTNGRPHIAWEDNSGGDAEIYYAYWDGDSWETYGGANTGGGLSNNAGDSYRPSLALDTNGNPHIAWEDYSGGGNREIYYRYWSPCQCPEGSSKGCISGTVTDGAGAPIAGRVVGLLSKGNVKPPLKKLVKKLKAVTDSNGCYVFSDLPDGRYDVYILAGACGRHQFVEIKMGGKVNGVNFECQ